MLIKPEFEAGKEQREFKKSREERIQQGTYDVLRKSLSYAWLGLSYSMI